VDSVKKGPSIVYWLKDALYLNITNRCPNNCYFCFRNFSNGVGGFNLKLHFEPSSKKIVTELQKVINKRHWREVVFCGFGEPTERLDCIIEVTNYVNRFYKKNIRVNTNGLGVLLNSGRNVTGELKEAGVNKISVSLNAHDKETYEVICKPKFKNSYKSVINFIKKSKKKLETEITAVTINEVNLQKMKEIAEEIGVNFRIREYIPLYR
jgi:TatD family-associated radical SAM protein